MREELDTLIARGLVEKVLLLAAELGGQEVPVNITYLPAQAAAQKRAFDARVREIVAQGTEVDYRVVPEYDSDSFVPARLVLDATGDAVSIGEVIDVAIHRSWEPEHDKATDQWHAPLLREIQDALVCLAPPHWNELTLVLEVSPGGLG